jgi:hypothetical protein
MEAPFFLLAAGIAIEISKPDCSRQDKQRTQAAKPIQGRLPVGVDMLAVSPSIARLSVSIQVNGISDLEYTGCKAPLRSA